MDNHRGQSDRQDGRPEVVYSRSGGRQPRSVRPQGNPPQHDNWGETPYEEYDLKKLKKSKHPFLYAFVIFICLVLTISIFILAAPQLLGFYWQDLPNFAYVNGKIITYNAQEMNYYRTLRDYMQQDTIYPGIYIDNVYVGGKTKDEARQLISESGGRDNSAFSVNVVIGNMSWTIDSSNVPITHDSESVLDKAYAYGRQISYTGTGETPLAQRAQVAESLSQFPVQLTTSMTYDREAVRTLVRGIASYINRDAIDAQLLSFDYATRTFSYSDEADGCSIDENALYEKVISTLDAGSYGQTIQMDVQITKPAVTKLQLMNNFKLLVSFTTKTTSDSARNTNINLAAQCFNGLTVMPGETVSFNQTTGQRTSAKGYKEAGAIAGGQSIKEVGGGVCQVATTLFNAVMRADLEIVDRDPHAWPATYVPKGEDATVNWPNLDFSFKNNKNTPIFIVAYYQKQTVTIELYGYSLGEGVSLDLYSVVTRTLEPSSEINYVQNLTLPYGTQNTTVKKRTGYAVDTYKVWYQNGVEVKREFAYSTIYKAYQQTIEYN